MKRIRERLFTMCYASPGPRCFGHAKETYEKALAQTSANMSAEISAQRDTRKFEPETPEHEQALKKLEQARGKLEKCHEKTHNALKDMQETKGGLEELGKSYKKIRSRNGENSYETRRHRDRLEEAEAGFNARMKLYDEKYHTVNGRKPSGYASGLGLDYLTKKSDNLRQKITVAKEKGTDTTKLSEQLKAVQNQQAFARNTLRRIEQGTLSRLYAHPAPALRKTPEYESYVRTAQAAPEMKITAQELNAIGLRSNATLSPHPLSPEYKSAVNRSKNDLAIREAKNVETGKRLEEQMKQAKLKVAPHVPLQDRPYLERKRLEEQGVKPDVEGQEILF